MADHSLSQRNRATEKTVGVGIGGNWKVNGVVGQNLKKGVYTI